MKISINDISILVVPGTTVLQACESIGIEIPRFCFHERLNVAGNCRMCLVEVVKSPKPQASCALPVVDKMQIYTDSPLVKKARESVLEMMLKNHPLDCPICDQGGECDLQDEAWAFGRRWSRFSELKRSVNDKNLGSLVKTVMNRCIHCTRCVRFANEIAGIGFLGTTSRGESTEITTYVDQLLNSEISGNVIDLCPVGALTSKPYAFTARPWELSRIQRLDLTDALGSNIQLDIRGSDLLRILPRLNEQINEEWLTDKGRFSHDGLSNQRLIKPIAKIDSVFKQVNFAETWEIIESLLASNMKSSIGFFPGKLIDFETSVKMQNLIDTIPNSFVFNSRNIQQCHLVSDFGFNQSFSDLEQSDYCLLLAVNPRTEGSLINTRLRKGALSGCLSISNFGPSIDSNLKINQLGTNLFDLIQFLEGKHFFSKDFINSKRPRIIVGDSFFEMQGSNVLLKYIQLHCSNINFLHVRANHVNQSILGLQSKNQISHASLGIALENDVLESSIPHWIYLGSHVSDTVLRNPNLRLCLPVSRFIEKSSHYLSLNKLNQKTNKAIDLNLQSSSTWLEQIQFLILDYNIQLNLKCYLNYQESSQGIHILNYLNSQTSSLCNLTCDVLDEEQILFQPNIICQNSAILASCAKNKYWLNFNSVLN